jgi:beta-xylosidase
VPTVLTLLAGRPYALGDAAAGAHAIIQAFFPGEEGTGAVAGVISGRVNPSGRLPVSVPAHPGAQPSTYLAAALGNATKVSNLDPTPAFPFGHGIGYSRVEWSDLAASADEIAIDGSVTMSLTLRNTGDRDTAEIVQVYLHDPVATVVRPVQRLVGFQRVTLAAGQSVRVSVEVPADLAWFTLRNEEKIVEPGDLVLSFGRSSGDRPLAHTVRLLGARRSVDHTRALHPSWTIEG